MKEPRSLRFWAFHCALCSVCASPETGVKSQVEGRGRSGGLGPSLALGQRQRQRPWSGCREESRVFAQVHRVSTYSPAYSPARSNLATWA